MPSKGQNRRNRKPIVLTRRDTELLRYIAAFGVLSTDQICRLCFRSVSRARRRLKQLWQHAFIRRSTRPVRVGEGTSPYLYSLANKGRNKLAQSDNHVKPFGAKRSLGLHASQITDLHIALMNATKGTPNHALTAWLQGKGLRFQGTVTTGGKALSVPIIPDAFFALTVAGTDFAYLLEIDRGTTDLTRMRTKFLAYLDLWQTKAVQTSLGVRSFRVLYVTNTETRLQHLLSVLRDCPGPKVRRDIIACTSFSSFTLDDPKQLFTPIWVTSTTTGESQTIEPLPPLHSSTFPTTPGKPPVRGPDAGAR